MNATNKFPIYQADQVLSANHLNQSLAYLEKHDRLSRRLLHGIGIVCGLDFRVTEGVLTITKGCGVTSEGYLIALEEALSLTQVRDYIPPYPPKYMPFYDDSENPFPLWEAIPQSEAEGENRMPLAEFNLQDKVLLLYLEAKDKDLKECVGDDCDNMGVVREFTIRPLLIRLVDLVKIFNKDGNSIEDIASSVLAYNYLQEIIPPRFDVLQSNLKTIVEVNTEYASISDELFKKIKQSLILLETLFANALGLPKSMAADLTALQAKMDTAKSQDLGQQYFYDHLCDVAAAYNELAETASQWLVTCMPDEDDFPRHLVLGEFTEIKANTPKIFRTYFKHAPTSPNTHNQQKTVLHLYKRLIKIMRGFALPSAKEVRVMRSTTAQALSNKAIPYYYQPANKADKSWLLQWSFEKYMRAVWQRNAHYYNDPKVQLQQDLEHYNFLRIEGHLGKPYNRALAEIQAQTDAYRLPIKTVALAAGPVPFDISLLEECNIRDLEADFERLRESLYCQMQEVSCFFAATPVTPQYRTIGEASNEANETAAASPSEQPKRKIESHKMLFEADASVGIGASINRIALVTGKASTTFKKGQFLASRCSIRPETMGANYLEFINQPEFEGKSLLDLYLPYLNMGQLTPSQRLLYLVYFFPYMIIDELEELAGIMHEATLSTTNFKLLQAFGEEFMAFIKLYLNEIDKMEKTSEFDLTEHFHDIKHKLTHLVSLCKLKAFFALYRTYRTRIKTALDELQFGRFIRKHPGIDHKAGAPMGGTFILVYHSTEQEEDEEDLVIRERPKLNLVSPSSYFDNVMASNPNVKATAKAINKPAANMSIAEANQWMTNNVYTYGRATGKQVNVAVLNQFREFLSGIAIRKPDEISLPEGTVFADFFLPYICCSSCGGIEINIKEPEQTVSITLGKRSFCTGDKNKEPFVVSPEGGVVSGPGVEPVGDNWEFNPSAEDVEPGKQTFTYSFEGKTAQTQAMVLATPEADFEYGIDATPNGTYLSLQNKSVNAKTYLWDFGNTTPSTAENPPAQYYPIGQETAVVTLTASNGECNDVESKTITLYTKSYSMAIGKESTDFCGLDEEHEIRLFIQGIGQENYPFDGIVKGDGVLPPDEAAPYFKFNPKKAGVGTHKLTYEVEGKEAATLQVVVHSPFTVSFKATADRSENGLTMTFSEIKPTGKPAYMWYFDQLNPSNNAQRTDAKKFTHYYSPREIADRQDITIRLMVRDEPCYIDHNVTVDIPDLPSDDNTRVLTFDPSVIRNSITIATPVAVSTTSVLSGRTSALSMSTSNPFVAGNKLLTDLKTTLGNTAQRKKLVGGKMNVELGKDFGKVLSGIQNAMSKNRRSLSAAKKAEVFAFYGNVAEALINVVGLLESDLKQTETLAKTLKSAGQGMKAMVALGMGSAVKNGIKNRLTALYALNKPVAASIALTINGTL